MIFLNLFICFSLVRSPLNDVRPYVKNFGDKFFMVFETDSGIKLALFDSYGILMDSFYIERNNLNPDPDSYKVYKSPRVAIIDTQTGAVSYMVTYKDSIPLNLGYYSNIVYKPFVYTNNEFSFQISQNLHTAEYGLYPYEYYIGPEENYYFDNTDSFFISPSRYYLVDPIQGTYYSSFASSYKFMYDTIFIEKAILKKSFYYYSSCPSVYTSDSSFYIFLIADTSENAPFDDTLYIFKNIPGDTSFVLVFKEDFPFDTVSARYESLEYLTYTKSFYNAGDYFVTASDNSNLYIVTSVDSFLLRNVKYFDFYVLYPKVYFFFIRNDTIWGRVYKFNQGFILEKPVVMTPGSKKDIKSEFNGKRFILVYSKLNSTWDISGIFVDTLLNVGIEEDFIKIQDSPPEFKSFVIFNQDKKLCEFLKDKKIFAISGRKSEIKKGIYFIRTNKTKYKLILLK